MNVGLLTFSMAYSYGAVLQCYALSKCLKNNGYSVVLLRSDLKGQTGWKYDLRNLTTFRFFRQFRKKYLPSFVKKENLQDMYIVGSDQVWNPVFPISPMNYFFDFLPAKTKRIAYAASFGVDDWKYLELTPQVKHYLQFFSAVSVRENSGKKICNDVFGIDAEVVLDPTLLVNDYSELTGVINIKKTLVCYRMVNTEDCGGLITEICNELGLKIKELKPQKILNFLPSIRNFNYVYPKVENWVKSIAEASFVMTDSFHAMVFAIIYRKQFIVLPSNRSVMGRVISLLTLLGIPDRYYESVDEACKTDAWMNPIDYEKVFEKLKKMQKHSLDFLFQNIKK